jgi:Flp pilus assembly pilin Flp
MRHLIKNDEGQNAPEYGLLVTGVGLLVLIGTSSLGSSLHEWYAVVAARITSLIGA